MGLSRVGVPSVPRNPYLRKIQRKLYIYILNRKHIGFIGHIGHIQMIFGIVCFRSTQLKNGENLMLKNKQKTRFKRRGRLSGDNCVKYPEHQKNFVFRAFMLDSYQV